MNILQILSGQNRSSGAMLESKAIAKAPDGEGCPRCGGYVYAAEQMLARGKVMSETLLRLLIINKCVQKKTLSN